MVEKTRVSDFLFDKNILIFDKVILVKSVIDNQLAIHIIDNKGIEETKPRITIGKNRIKYGCI